MPIWIFDRGEWEETKRDDLAEIALALEDKSLADYGYRTGNILNSNDILGDEDAGNDLQIHLASKKTEFYAYMEICISGDIESIFVKDFPSFIMLTKDLTQLLHNLSHGTYDEYEALRKFKRLIPSAATTIQLR